MIVYKGFIRVLVNVFFIVLFGSVFGCGTHQGGIPTELKFAEVPTNPQSLAHEYRISPGDQLDIKFFYNADLNEMLPVRPDGKISLRLVGDVQAAGLQPSELVADLKNRYAHELRQPEITVIVKTFTAQQIFVDGEVEHPGQVELASGLTVWQAVVKSGGFKNTATRESVILIRRGEHNQPIAYRINLTPDSMDQATASLPLQPYDVVFVPKTWVAEADKFMLQYVQDLLLFKGWYFNLNPVPAGF